MDVKKKKKIKSRFETTRIICASIGTLTVIVPTATFVLRIFSALLKGFTIYVDVAARLLAITHFIVD